MPALEACGRKWEFGSDDLVFPGLASLFVRVLWLLGVVVAVVYFHKALMCQDSHRLAGFSLAVVAVIMVTVLLEGIIICFSCRGTVIRTRPRKPVVHLLHFRVLVFFLEVVLLIIGTVFAYGFGQNDTGNCDQLGDAYLLVQIISVVNWCVLATLVIFAFLYLDPCHCYRPKVNFRAVDTIRSGQETDETVIQYNWQLTHTMWEKRFRTICCGYGTEDKHQLAYSEVAEIFAHIFCDTNVVFSDIAAGLVLLQKEHIAAERKRRRRQSLSSIHERVQFDFEAEDERRLLESALHYHKYALGIYSWLLYMYMNPWCGCCGLCKLLSCCTCCSCLRKQRTETFGDNSSCHLVGLRKLTHLLDDDLVYVTFENDLYQSPFLVCLDHSKQAVVIAVRGTLSMHDVMTDLSAHTHPMELPDSPGFVVHKGMFHTAKWVLGKLSSEQLLEKAFQRCPDYRLVLVGHSLGSGCACILSMLLRPEYPGLHCFCISPSGAVVNEEAARHTEEFVTSVTLGQDLVARLNVRTAHVLKEDLVRVLENTQKPKFRILLEGGLETLCKCCGRPVLFDEDENNIVTGSKTREGRREEEGEGEGEGEGEEERKVNECHDERIALTDEEDPVGGSGTRNNPEASLEITPLLERGLSSMRVRRVESTSAEDPLVPLYPPGKIMHIMEEWSYDDRYCCGRKTSEITWVHRTAFDRIVVSPDMIRDHLPNIIFDSMEFFLKQNSK